MKPLLTSQQLIEHMKNKGVSFDLVSETDAKDFLEKHNYYMKLAAYRENYQKYPNSSKRAGQYINLDFAYLQELSTIDRHLRYQILQMCLDIEHFLKVALLNAIENNPNEDGYCIVHNFIANTSNNLRDIRNACAHSNCLINKLKPNGNRPHSSVVNRVKSVPGISESSRDKKLKNSCIYDYICMLYAYNEIVSSSESRKKPINR
ncbi:MAG: Abi family protein [Clostridiales bacterium]|nr:Abi family protein [Clostridiales bacterium]